MTYQYNEPLPKYACRECGSDEIRGESDSYPVFRAEDDKIVYLRSETLPGGPSYLYCNECEEPIEADDIGGIEID